MYSKVENNVVVLDNVNGPQDYDMNMFTIRDCSIQVTYGAGGSGDLELYASNDDVNYSLIAGSEQTVDIAGGSHIWEIGDYKSLYLRVSIPAVNNVTVRVIEIRLKDME